MPESDYIDDATAPVKKPEGAPDLTPLLQLPRRQRANVLRTLGELRERQSKMPDAPEELSDEEAASLTEEQKSEREKVGLDRGAAMFDLLADFEDLMRLVASDPEHFEAWLSDANDADLSKLAGYYMRTFQPGEAQASPAS